MKHDHNHTQQSEQGHAFLRTRAYLEALEDQVLAPYACRSALAETTRGRSEQPHAYRTAFQRDRDRLVHSRAFRRLKHKRQVFLTDEGDHYRTRLTHTLEVSQLARTVAKALGLNEELVEAIALGHDLGHTPFGHIGEVVLGKIMSGKDTLDGLLPAQSFGGFKHNYQSLRVVDHIERKYARPGLNLTAAVREGILKHTRLQEGVAYPDFDPQGLHLEQEVPTTLEGQVVAICDEIAQHTHDLEDGIRANFVALDQVRRVTIVRQLERELGLETFWKEDPFLYRNLLIKGLINALISDLLRTTASNLARLARPFPPRGPFAHIVVHFSAELEPLHRELDQFIDDEIIYHASIYRADDLAVRIIRELFKFYLRFPSQMPEYVLGRIASPGELPQLVRAICDHIAGMSDNYAETEWTRVEQIVRSLAEGQPGQRSSPGESA
ncbi:MAG: dNTP triphosphohydrolase [candidate division KSB1 bacterium]|nr:dNTP triphosphohydrolase [candidate division KSB1 bacterium]